MPNEIEIPNLPDVKIIQNGKQVDTSTIDNYDSFMAFLMQASIAANTAKIRKYYDDRTPLGRTQNFELHIMPDSQGVRCIYPSQSFHIVNDGPGEIFVNLNTGTRDATRLLLHGELTVDFETHKLKRFYVWSAPGTIATARAVVKF